MTADTWFQEAAEALGVTPTRLRNHGLAPHWRECKDLLCRGFTTERGCMPARPIPTEQTSP
jgi:hypothetical protein